MPVLDAEGVEDLEDAPDQEVEEAEETILDQATAARTIAELRAEIETLLRLETLALTVRRSGGDTKWRELASLLSGIFTPDALAHDAMDASRVHRIREDLERAEARLLQPHNVESFFLEAFRRLGEQ